MKVKLNLYSILFITTILLITNLKEIEINKTIENITNQDLVSCINLSYDNNFFDKKIFENYFSNMCKINLQNYNLKHAYLFIGYVQTDEMIKGVEICLTYQKMLKQKIIIQYSIL